MKPFEITVKNKHSNIIVLELEVVVQQVQQKKYVRSCFDHVPVCTKCDLVIVQPCLVMYLCALNVI